MHMHCMEQNFCGTFLCSKFMRCSGFRFWPHVVQTYGRWEWKIAEQIDLIVASFTQWRSLQSVALALTNLWPRSLTWGDRSRYSPKYIPRYFTWLDVDAWSFVPHNVKFRSKSSCFSFLLKIMTSVLATLREILFACSHWIRNLRSLLTTLFTFLIEPLMFSRQVSSTKWKVSEFFYWNIKVINEN